jgi:hypothetical protein
VRRNLSERVAALEQSSKGDFTEVWPIGYFYGDDVQPELILLKEWKRRMKLGLDGFYGAEAGQ